MGTKIFSYNFLTLEHESAQKIFLPSISDIYDLCDLDNGWHPYDQQCYKYFAEPRDWNAASKACQDQRGMLIMLEEEIKYHILSEVIDCTDFDRGIWIGLSDTASAPMTFLNKHFSITLNNKPR